MSPAIQEPPNAANVVRLTWSSTGTPLVLGGGSLAGTVTSLQPASYGGQTLAAPPNDTGLDFFSLAAGVPAAIGLSVATTDQISQLREGNPSPDADWRNFVVDLGVTSEAATRKAAVSETFAQGPRTFNAATRASM